MTLPPGKTPPGLAPTEQGAGALSGTDDTELPIESSAASAETEAGEPVGLELTAEATSEPVRTAGLPERLGRFVIQKVLGAGGMGVVYLARDPELDRDVAVKVLKLGGREHRQVAEQLEARLVREAQAMARLRHENVITVYDVGRVGAQVFIAMEFIDGDTLSGWIKEERRSQREILDVYRSAGRGLAAAHQAALVHRDFKPDNVLISKDGHVRVTDFGLVRKLDEEPESLANRDDPPSALDHSLTHTGALLGTPAYMAPEQHRGDVSDEKSDQFSFCVSLFEALYGERPFAGDTLEELRKNVEAGRVRECPPGLVPKAIQAALLTGLSVDPKRRFASMEELLSALEPRKMPVAKLVGGGVAAVALVAGAFAMAAALESSPREIAEAELAVVWNDEARDTIRTAFAKVDRPPEYTSAQATRVIAALDKGAERSIDEKSQAWIDFHETESTTEELFNLRSQCFEGLHLALGDFVRDVSEGPEAMLDKAAGGAETLAREACPSDRLKLKPSAPEEHRPEIRELEIESRRLAAEVRSRRNPKSLEPLMAVVERARELGYAPLLRDALFSRGTLQALVGDYVGSAESLVEASKVASAANDPVLESEILFMLALTQAAMGRESEVASWLRAGVQVSQRVEARGSEPDKKLVAIYRARGEALTAFLLKDTEVEAKLKAYLKAITLGPESVQHLYGKTLLFLGKIAVRKGDVAAAESHFRESLKELEATVGPDHPSLNRTLVNLANLMTKAGRFSDALGYYRQAIGILEVAQGKDSPSLAGPLEGAAIILLSMSNYDEALALSERAFEVVSEFDLKRKATLHSLQAGILSSKGDPHAALASTDSALKLLKLSGPETPEWVSSTCARGVILLDLERHDEAEKTFQRADAIATRVVGARHVDGQCGRVGLGMTAAARKRFGIALSHYREVHQVTLAAFGPKAAATLVYQGLLADSLASLGRYRQARLQIDEAFRDTAALSAAQLAMLNLTRAKVLWLKKSERRVAVLHGINAWNLVITEPEASTTLREARDWVRTHKLR